ncbi:2OG-Fe(II) oxygenase [Gayadomonas joobiniege]|uniref:2OG-Fe(II) oxygenase n=1 Tax=Gayadomonas joobiniege TaxID=1234606 RepID=UPI000370157E|nr:2OG-Fe(II) oxygenase [Gayadomonas joobiniege]
MFELADSNASSINFLAIANALQSQGYAIIPHALPVDIETSLIKHAVQLSEKQMKQAAIGRNQNETTNKFVRQDKIVWIKEGSAAEKAWLAQMSLLREQLNRQLFLGLFSYESHFACYPEGAFYKKHLDAFKGQANRILSTVYYLNPNWQPEDGGELVIYDPADNNKILTQVSPQAGTMVVFLSEEFPHEVLAAKRTRYSIAGWFRLNTSVKGQIDPPK